MRGVEGAGERDGALDGDEPSDIGGRLALERPVSGEDDVVAT